MKVVTRAAMQSSGTQGQLAGKKIWLTRPQVQVGTLPDALEQLGAEVLLLPLLDIKAITPAQADRQKLLNLDQYDLVFFVSTNAAAIGLDAISHWWPQYPVHLQNFAVGPSTAAVLEKQGLQVCFPREGMNSEALLALPELQDIAGKKALIIRGVGGREIIAEGLQLRGVRADYAELYERTLPNYEQAWLSETLQDHLPDAIVISSAEAMENLQQLFAPIYMQWQQFPLLVSSSRLLEHARARGFVQVFVMAGATDAAIIAGLLSVFAEPILP